MVEELKTLELKSVKDAMALKSSIEQNLFDVIKGQGILEKIADLPSFIEAVYHNLKVGGKAEFTSPYYTSTLAWADPTNLRGLSELSMNFASKEWRAQNNFEQTYGRELECDFVIGCNFAVDQAALQRSEEAKAFWLVRYNNVAQAVMFSLEKK